MVDATNIESIRPIGPGEVRTLAATEYVRLVEQLESLTDEDWSKPTDCHLWDVRDVAGHCVGMMSDFTSLRSVLRRMLSAGRQARREGGPVIDSVTSQQVADYADLTVDELIWRARRNGPRAARWRSGAPRLLRRMPMKEEVGGKPETWRLGYVLDVILTRDPWMHRIDVAQATGRQLALTADHDGRLVADVVAEWGRRHGQPFALTLTGPAGGHFVSGNGSGNAQEITMDAVEFCRTLSGRAPGSGLLSLKVPFRPVLA